jgi:RNA polymerase sigma-70 factor, ECF subfamily
VEQPVETSASLLERLRHRPDEDSWQRLDDLYRPLIRHWLRRDPTLGEEAEDLTQEIMSVLVREVRGFRRQRTGSFRRWLRAITVHRLQWFQRTRRGRPQACGGPPGESPLTQLADPASELSRSWDREHDEHVVRRLLDLLEPEFEPDTLLAFRRVVLDEVKPAQVAAEMGKSVNAVLLAKSRVLQRLRQEAAEFLD